MRFKKNRLILWLIAVGLLFPVFFQISGGIYINTEMATDSGGVIESLPLPLSLFASALGILVLAGQYRRAKLALQFITVLFATMLVSLFFAGVDHSLERSKVLIGIQFLLPTMGLILGQLVEDDENVIQKAFMWVLMLIVPIQLLAGWWQKTLTLTHHLYLFSIYQHFQYVPVIFVLAFCWVMVSLWNDYKTRMWFLALVMGIYAIASASFLAIGLYAAFVFAFFLRELSHLKTGRLFRLTIFCAGVVAAYFLVSFYYTVAQKNTSIVGDYGKYIGKFQTLTSGKMPVNVDQRLADWRLYLNWITESNHTLIFGHVKPPPREVKTSAHNWYLDFVRNFGLVSLAPFLALVAFTCLKLMSHRKKLSAQTQWLAVLVAFLVLIDSNFKVTLRQPYPGIFAYFLWGLLLTRLCSPSRSGLDTRQHTPGRPEIENEKKS